MESAKVRTAETREERRRRAEVAASHSLDDIANSKLDLYFSENKKNNWNIRTGAGKITEKGGGLGRTTIDHKHQFQSVSANFRSSNEFAIISS